MCFAFTSLVFRVSSRLVKIDHNWCDKVLDLFETAGFGGTPYANIRMTTASSGHINRKPVRRTTGRKFQTNLATCSRGRVLDWRAGTCLASFPTVWASKIKRMPKKVPWKAKIIKIITLKHVLFITYTFFHLNDSFVSPLPTLLKMTKIEHF